MMSVRKQLSIFLVGTLLIVIGTASLLVVKASAAPAGRLAHETSFQQVVAPA